MGSGAEPITGGGRNSRCSTKRNLERGGDRREPSQVIVEVLGWIGDSWCRGKYTKRQHTGHNGHDFAECHLPYPQSFTPGEKSLSLLEPITPEYAPEKLPVPIFFPIGELRGRAT